AEARRRLEAPRPRPPRQGGWRGRGRGARARRGVATVGRAEQALRRPGQAALLRRPEHGGRGVGAGHRAADGPPLLGLRPRLALRRPPRRLILPPLREKTETRWQTCGKNGALARARERGWSDDRRQPGDAVRLLRGGGAHGGRPRRLPRRSLRG